MATWRRKAMALLPAARGDLQRRDYPISSLFTCYLKPAARLAHEVEDEEALRQFYEFAGWCLQQHADEVRDAARLSFYWHIFDVPRYRTAAAAQLTPEVVACCWPMWERILSAEELVQVRRAISGGRRKPRQPEV